MAIIAAIAYNPSTQATQALTGSAVALTALDTTNLRQTFTVPSSGIVVVRLACPLTVYNGGGSSAKWTLGILTSGGSTVGNVTPKISYIYQVTASNAAALAEAVLPVPGLTPGASLTWDAAYAIAAPPNAGSLAWGGIGTNSTNVGAFCYEIYG